MEKMTAPRNTANTSGRQANPLMQPGEVYPTTNLVRWSSSSTVPAMGTSEKMMAPWNTANTCGRQAKMTWQSKSTRNPSLRSSSSTISPMGIDSAEPRSSSKSSNGRKNSSTCLGHLDLGDVGTTKDMLECDPFRAWEMIFSLQKHAFAFILRSDGSWTYAIIADRREKSMRFVVDTKGATKTLSRKTWLDSVRLVNNRNNREKIDYCLPSVTEADPPGIKIPSSLPENVVLEEKQDEHEVPSCANLPFATRRPRGNSESADSLLSLFE